MKTLTLLFALIGLTTFGQITLEQTYSTNSGQQFYITNIGDENYKYVLEDNANSVLSLYNLDHSPFLVNIPIPVPSSAPANSYEVMYITRSLFDCDTSNVEFVLSAPYAGNLTFFIYRTDGNLIWSKDSVVGPYCFGCHGGSFVNKPIVNTPLGAKMFLINGSGDNFVYSLCGELPLSLVENENSQNSLKIFPNPASESMTFEIKPPTNGGDYELVIFNSMMQVVSKEKIYSETKMTKSLSEYSSGIYYYSFKSSYKVIQTGKFIVN